jgi:hypothetical protein
MSAPDAEPLSPAWSLSEPPILLLIDRAAVPDGTCRTLLKTLIGLGVAVMLPSRQVTASRDNRQLHSEWNRSTQSER